MEAFLTTVLFLESNELVISRRLGLVADTEHPQSGQPCCSLPTLAARGVRSA